MKGSEIFVAFLLTFATFFVTLTFIFYLFIYFLRQRLALPLRLDSSGMIAAHCKLHLLGSSDFPALASHVAMTTGMHPYAQLIFVFARLVLNSQPQ